MLPEKIDYEFKTGDTNALKPFKLKTSNEEYIIPDNNFEIYFTLKNFLGGKVKIQKKLSLNTIIFEDEKYKIKLSDKETSTFEGTYVYDIEFKNDTITKTLFEGEIKFSKDVTEAGDE